MTDKVWVVSESYLVEDEYDFGNFGTEQVAVCSSKEAAIDTLRKMFEKRVQELRKSKRAIETADIFEDEYEVVPEYDDEADNIRYRGKVFEI